MTGRDFSDIIHQTLYVITAQSLKQLLSEVSDIPSVTKSKRYQHKQRVKQLFNSLSIFRNLL